MHGPATEPIGLQLIRTGQLIDRAFDDALHAAGGSLPTWLALVALTGERHGGHSALTHAQAGEATSLTDQLDRLVDAGLLTRTPGPDDEHEHMVALTEAGDALFRRLLRAVVAFDARLRASTTDEQIAALSTTLEALQRNLADEASP